jgi:hypothetical protein
MLCCSAGSLLARQSRGLNALVNSCASSPALNHNMRTSLCACLTHSLSLHTTHPCLCACLPACLPLRRPTPPRLPPCRTHPLHSQGHSGTTARAHACTDWPLSACLTHSDAVSSLRPRAQPYHGCQCQVLLMVAVLAASYTRTCRALLGESDVLGDLMSLARSPCCGDPALAHSTRLVVASCLTHLLATEQPSLQAAQLAGAWMEQTWSLSWRPRRLSGWAGVAADVVAEVSASLRLAGRLKRAAVHQVSAQYTCGAASLGDVN